MKKSFKPYIYRGLIAIIAVLLGGTLVWAESSPTESTTQPQPVESLPSGLSTPELIEAALNNGEIDQETATLYLAYALGDHEKLPLRFVSEVPWHGTLPFLSLQEAVKTMQYGPARSEIEAVLTGSCGSSSGSLPNVTNSIHFHVEYGTIGGGLNINNYTASLETTWDTEVTSFGWAAPPVLTSNPPPGDRYHVRIDSLGTSLYGYVTNSGTHAGLVGNNPNTAWNDVDAYATCMVLNEDYSGFPGSAQQALDATTAHEFNHSIQFGYGAITGSNTPDSNFIEGGATWMEDEVFDASNDNWNYLWPTFTTCMGRYTPSPYPYWITFRGMTERYGTGTAGAGEQVMQDFWELTSQSSTSNMFPAINQALVNKGSTLAEAYHAYAIAVKFNKSCSGGYVYPYCLEEGPGYVSTAGATTVQGSIGSIGGSYSGSVAENYALNWVSLPTSGGAYNVTLENTSAGGQMRASVVCDTGTQLRVSSLPAVVGSGATSTLSNFNPSGCSSVVAVITNQMQTADNPTSCLARSYQLRTSPGTSYEVYLPLVMVNYTASTLGFDSQFNGNADGWVSHSGDWYIGSEVLWTNGLADLWSTVSYTQDFSNFDLEVKMGRLGNGTNANRVLVRGTPSPLDSSNDWYSYYAFQYNRNGSYAVWKRVAGSSTELQGWTASPAIIQGDYFNVLRVVANGSSLSFYINDTLVWSGTDTSLTTGRVGVGMFYPTGSTGDQLQVDWATLYELHGKTIPDPGKAVENDPLDLMMGEQGVQIPGAGSQVK